MDIFEAAAANILKRFRYEDEKLCLLADEAFTELAQSMKKLHAQTEIRRLSSETAGAVENLLRIPSGTAALLLAEPETYLKMRLFEHLDFSEGEPRIPDAGSRVWIFPRESLLRILAVPVERDLKARDAILAGMEEDRDYRITTSRGTDLVFHARKWIPLDFEVCTAPVESSISGVIVADGALFFRSINSTVTLEIKDGKIASVSASDPEGERLAEEYRNMTAREMRDPVNTQLAEIGIGFCGGAAISDCFMEAETVLNTCHFCFGNNVCYGGKNESDFHGASVLIRDPVFTRIR